MDYDTVPPTGFGTTLCKWTLVIISVLLLVFTFPFSLIVIIKVIPQYERAVIFRLGRIKDGKEQGPGLFFVIPCIDKVERVDTRLKTFDVPPQRVRKMLTQLIKIFQYYVICILANYSFM